MRKSSFCGYITIFAKKIIGSQNLSKANIKVYHLNIVTTTEILVLVPAVLEALVLRYIKFLGYQIFPCGNTEALQGQRIDSYHSVSSNCDQDKSICNNPFALSDDQHI